jgi:uncharacterized protein YbjT (DUF2867 family)
LTAPTTEAPPAAPPAVALDDLAAAITAFVTAEANIRQWTEVRDGWRRLIEARIGDAEVGTVAGRPRVRRTRYIERRLNTPRLRELVAPDLIAACTVTSERTRFSLVEDDR